MTHNKYFKDELDYLKEAGREFAESNHTLSKYLSEGGEDPDVGRLLEGFAFLTAKIRQKLEDELPEFTHSLINMLWPNYLRPIPSFSILEFIPRKHILSDKKTLKQGVEVASVEVEGSSCIFRSCYDVDVYPIELVEAEIQDRNIGSQLQLRFHIEQGVASELLSIDCLRIYLNGEKDGNTSKLIYMWLFRYLNDLDIELRFKNGETQLLKGVNKDCIAEVGFNDSEALLPGSENTFSGFRLLQEYFLFPEKFMFFDVGSLQQYLSVPNIQSFNIHFNFSRTVDNLFKVRSSHFKLFCTPIVNLFSMDAEPINIDHKKTEYFVSPQYKNKKHIEIFSTESVTGRVKGRAEKNEYSKFESFTHEVNLASHGEGNYYNTRQAPSVLKDGNGVDHYIRVTRETSMKSEPVPEILSIKLSCTNGELTSALKAGSIVHDIGRSPDYVSFKNISYVSEYLPPPTYSHSHWSLISHLGLNYRALDSLDALKQLIRFYDFRAYRNRKLSRKNADMCEGIEKVVTKPEEYFHKDRLVLGISTELHLRESKFGAKGADGEANMYLFACVLNHYFSQYALANSFHRFSVQGLELGEEYKWKPLTGTRTRY